MLLGHMYMSFREEKEKTVVNMMADVYFRRGLKVYSVPVKKHYEMKNFIPYSVTNLVNDFKITCKNVAQKFNVNTDTVLEIVSYGQGKVITAKRVRIKDLLNILDNGKDSKL